MFVYICVYICIHLYICIYVHVICMFMLQVFPGEAQELEDKVAVSGLEEYLSSAHDGHGFTTMDVHISISLHI